ncbi:MAG TPA: efflux RND transporter periplasmic adaptor subunit [Stellaceae bacterium]|nr:efflux RND transporter periplasmic adaptor subunit [Stellaceae bacterium]
MVAAFSLTQRWALIAVPLALTIVQPAMADQANPKFACLIEPRMELKLGTAVPGLISQVLVDRGDFVKKGEVVARLESGVEAATVALANARAADDSAVQSAQAKLNFQLRKAARAAALRRNDNIALSAADEAETGAKVAEAEFHEAQMNLTLAKLEVQRATETLNQRTIRSPIDGVVTQRTLGPGEYAYDQSHLLTIAQIDPLKVEAFVPLSEFGRVHPGMSAEVYPEKPIGGKYDATVTVVDQVFDAASATIGIRLDLPNPKRALPAGLRCQVQFLGVS